MTRDEADRMTAAVVEFENLTKLLGELQALKATAERRKFGTDPAYATRLFLKLDFSGEPAGGCNRLNAEAELNANSSYTNRASGDVVTRCNHMVLNAMLGGVCVAIEDVRARLAAVKVAEPPAVAQESAR